MGRSKPSGYVLIPFSSQVGGINAAEFPFLVLWSDP